MSPQGGMSERRYFQAGEIGSIVDEVAKWAGAFKNEEGK